MMPPLFLIKLASAVVGNRLAKAGAWVLIALTLFALLAVGKCTYDANVVADHEVKVTREVLITDAKAKDEAAAQRATDVTTIDTAEKERSDAIQSEPASKPDAARNRLNCQRLRAQGLDTAGFAECR
jgi:hypothetical protein